jgi:hypothetical protein
MTVARVPEPAEMSSEPTPHEEQPTNTPPVDEGLPPVEPPSAGLMVRLFLVPGLIVAGLVLLFLAGPMLYRGVSGVLGFTPADDRSAKEFLDLIDNDNQDIRYRAANDLAQVLLRKDELAADPIFALELAHRLEATLDKSDGAEQDLEKSYGSLLPPEKAKEEALLQPNRNRVIYLTAALGNCMVPVGAPLMCRMAERTKGMEAGALANRRRRALFALATLGRNLERFDDLKEEKQQEVLDKLQGRDEVEAGKVRAYLQARLKGNADSFGVIKTLIECAHDEDPFIRQLSALAASYWYGTDRENRELEKELVKLSRDNGHGEDLIERQREKSWAETTRKGYAVQANATIALARRGSPDVRLDVLEELLQPEVLGELFVVRKSDGTHYPENSAIAAAVFGATRAVPVLIKKRPDMGSKLDRLRSLLGELAHHKDPEIVKEAVKALNEMGE